MVAFEKATPVNFSRNQIENLALAFADSTGYKAGEMDIIQYVKENLKGNIEYTDDDADSSGGSIVVKSRNDFTIRLSTVTSPRRDTFTVAHELGHYVLHSRLGQKRIGANRAAVNADLVEREANTFAAAFLMPEKLVREKFSKCGGDIGELANAFKVSYSAMKWRCHRLALTLD